MNVGVCILRRGSASNDDGIPLRSIRTILLSADETNMYATSFLDSTVIVYRIIDGRLEEV